MTSWEDSRNQSRRHKHTPVEEDGQMVCTGCRQIVTTPITDVADPRLQQAGFMRSPREDDEYDDEPYSQPLPEILIALHEHGPEYGYRQAPVAPYVVAVLHDGDNIRDDDLWQRLADKV